MMKKRDADGISGLPDWLLIEIVSRLPSTQEAIRTGTLSKRWKHLWTWVPTLILEPSSQYLHNYLNPKSDFALMVDKTLTQCGQLKRKKFLVHTFYDIRFESHYNDWIRYAISCNVEELNFDLERSESEADFLLDQSIFINSCFTKLRLAGCNLNPTGVISWENLTSLCISRAIIDEDLLVSIVSGSPLLETLVLEYCKWPDINSDDTPEFEATGISAPTISSLTQCCQLAPLKKFMMRTGFYFKFQSQLNNWIHYAIRCNVQELNLMFWNINKYEEEEDGFVLDQIVFTSSCFTKLRLDGCMLKPAGAISWKNLSYLCITSFMNLDEDLIGNILSGSPVLETLVLNECYGYRRLDITSKSVKSLVLDGYETPDDGESDDESENDIIEVNAPNILSLSIIGEFSYKPLLLNVSSLAKTCLNYTCTKYEHRRTTPTEAEQEMLKRYLVKLRHVKELILGVMCAKVLSCLQAKGFVSPSNVKLDRSVN